MRRLFCSIAVISLLAFMPPRSVYGQETPENLPQDIRTILDKDYPGWRFSEIIPEIYRFFKNWNVPFHPNFISADFDDNGGKDYAFQITYQGKRMTLAFLEKKNKLFEKYILEINDFDNTDLYLWLYRKGEKGYDYDTEKEFSYPTDAVGVNFFEKGGVSYIFENGSFRAICSSD